MCPLLVLVSGPVLAAAILAGERAAARRAAPRARRELSRSAAIPARIYGRRGRMLRKFAPPPSFNPLSLACVHARGTIAFRVLRSLVQVAIDAP